IFSPDVKYLVEIRGLGPRTKTVHRVWNIPSFESCKGIPNGYLVRFSTAGNILALQADGNVLFWDFKKSRVSSKLPVHQFVYQSSFSKDGKLFAIAEGEKSEVAIHEVSTGQLVKIFPTGGDFISELIFSPDFRTFMVQEKKTVLIW